MLSGACPEKAKLQSEGLVDTDGMARDPGLAAGGVSGTSAGRSMEDEDVE